jgi:radical SAM superfamily enzyme YgiQ (UPF0313 family)
VEVTAAPAAALRACRRADAAVFGEGEETLRDLLRRLAGGTDASLEGIPGLAWRRGGAVRRNDPRPPLPDLAAVPSPYLAGSFGEYLGTRTRVHVETTRGCPYRCAFCFESRGFQTVRSFPLDRVREEIAHLVRSGVREIEFLDTNFNHDRERALEILRFLRTFRRRVRWFFEIQAERLDEGQIRAIAGLDFFAEAGLQSTNPRTLRAVNRPLDIGRFGARVRELLNASIYRPASYSAGGGLMIDVMVGLPGDSARDVRRSFDYVFGLCPSKISVAMTKVLPGTKLHQEAKKLGLRFDPARDYVIVSTPQLGQKEVEGFAAFGHAVWFAYNKIHAVRTLAWTARKAGAAPSEVLWDLGRRMAASGIGWEKHTIQDLAGHLRTYLEDRDAGEAARKVGGKLNAEMLLNLLQKFRERRRSWWAAAVFGAGYGILRLLFGLPPLPDPVSREDAEPGTRN